MFDCYGPHHLSNAKADRQKLITNAFVFECKCPVGVTCNMPRVTCNVSHIHNLPYQACRDNWPMWNQVESRLSPGEMSKLGTSLSKYQVRHKINFHCSLVAH